MVHPWFGVGLGVLSCVAYTAAAVTQWRLDTILSTPLITRRAVLDLLRHPLWWIAALLNVARSVFQVGALALAPLSVVQPLGVLVLVFSVPWAARLDRRSVAAREWKGVLLTVLALAVLLAIATTGGAGRTLDPVEALGLTLGSLALLGAGVWIAGLVSPARRGPLLGVLAGAAFGIASALAKTAVDTVSDGGPAVEALPSVLGTATVALFGLFLSQAAYRGLEPGAPLGATVFANPVTATVIAIVLLGESYGGGPIGAGVALLCVLLCGYGLTLLTSVRDAGPGPAPEGRPPFPTTLAEEAHR
ncbi:DMT family transporter [Nocardiopsis alba]|uniref:DMT family transporter n=1 Tax=Nocardiopsis alba TaxID=53437 RepID=UPI0033AB44ED